MSIADEAGRGGTEVSPWEHLADALILSAVAARAERGDERAAVDLPSLTAALGTDPGSVGTDLSAERAAFGASLDDDTTFASIVRRAALDADEAEVLAIACATELHPARQVAIARLNGEPMRSRVSLQLLRELLGAEHLGPRVVSTAGALRRSALARLEGDGPWGTKVVAVSDTVLWRLIGSTAPDPHLPVDTEWVDGAGDDTDGVHLLVVTGDDRTRRIQTAIVDLAATSSILVRVPSSGEQWEGVIRQATLDGLGVILDAPDGLPTEARWWIDRSWHLPWAIVTPADLPMELLPRRPWIGRRAPAAAASRAEVAAVADGVNERGHRFTADQLRQLRVLLPSVDGDVDEAVRRIGGGALDTLARRIHPHQTRDQLVLGEDQSRQIEELIARYRNGPLVYGEWSLSAHPSAGISALFAGPPGTGKTAAAEVVAGAIGLDLCVVDLASVVSKYIGETEKNLDEVFDAAAAGNVVLLFDEADALFGKRTEVSDAHDRYANLEISYLLQRIERFDGLVVLTTNYFGNIDQAFLRRITFTVEFQLPSVDERVLIWRRYLDVGVPLARGADAVDVDLLAQRFEISGAMIRNVVTSAAFLAAAAEGRVTMTLVQHALRRELRKMGRLLDEADFAP